jgi:hypothetical protein
MPRVAVLLLVTLLALDVSAQEEDESLRASTRQLGREAQELFEAGDYQAALDKYERAAALVDVPTIHVRVARTLMKLRRFVAAAERYRRVVRAGVADDAPDVLREALADAQRELAALEPRIPWVVIALDDRDGVALSIDGVAVPLALVGVKRAIDPGSHTLQAERGGAQTQQAFTIQEGQTLDLSITPPPVSAPPPPQLAPDPIPLPPPPADTASTPWHTPLGWSLLGVGAAGVVVGGILGGVALSKKGDLEAACGGALECPPDAHGDADSYNALRVPTTIAFVAGGVLAAAGVTILLTAPGDDTVASLGAHGVRWRW